MALPTKKKRGLRVLTHKGTGYYWKVKVNDDYEERSLDIVIGLEKKASSFFTVFFIFNDPFLHFPKADHKPGENEESLKPLKALEKVSPALIAEAIDVADQESWEEFKHFALIYKDGVFSVTKNFGRMHL